MKLFQKIVILALGLCSFTSLRAQVTLEWANTHYGNTNYYAYSYFHAIATDATGNVYVAGEAYNTNNTYSSVIVKYSANGTLLWSTEYAPGQYNYTRGGIAIDANNNVYVSGYTYTYNYNYNYNNYNDLFVYKVDSDGNTLWSRVYDSGNNEYMDFTGISLAQNGDVVIGGQVYYNNYNNGNYSDILMVRYDSNGNELWAYTSATNSYEYLRSIEMDAAGNAYGAAAVYNYNGYSNNNIGLVKVDPNGNEVAYTLTNNPTNEYTECYYNCLAVNPNGEAYITGYKYNNYGGNYDVVTMKYDNNSAIQWTKMYDSGSYDYYGAIETDNNGNAVVACNSYNNSNNHYNWRVLRYDADGNEVSNTVALDQNNTAYYSYNWMYDIDVDATNNAYVTGYEYTYDYNYYYSGKVATSKVNTDGSIAWTERYAPNPGINNYSYSYAYDVLVDNSNNVYVSGMSYNPSVNYNYGMLTLKYSQGFTPVAPEFTTTVTNTSCINSTDGAIVVNVTEGNQAPFSYSIDNGVTFSTENSFSGLAAGTYTVVVKDAGNLTTIHEATVGTNPDTEIPNAIAQSITISLDANGQATIDASAINNGSTDNCGIASITVSPSNFSCENVGDNAVTLTVTDNSGNTATADAVVTVEDNAAPIALCQNVTTTLNGGAASVTAEQVNAGSTDACGITSLSIPAMNFTCGQAGVYPVTLTVTDANGNASTCSAEVTVIGDVPTCSITSVPTSNVFTGGNPNELYLGYGAQSTTLTTAVTGAGTFTYQWTGSNLSSTTSANPVFTPSTAGTYQFTVDIVNSFGCKTSCTITICVYDIRVPGQNNKVYICHVPNGNPSNAQTLSISVNAVPSHLGLHSGDRLGSCSMTRCNFAKNGSTEEENISFDHEGEVSVYPNPNNGTFLLHGHEAGEYQLLDQLGKLIQNVTLTEDNGFVVEVVNLNSGVYFIVGTTEHGQEFHKVVVNN